MAISCLALAEETSDPLEVEKALVEEKLTKEQNQVVLAVDGLCCRSCAIGIGKKVCKLTFVDPEALPKGVTVDRKNSLLTVAVKENESIDIDELAKAIRKAGYKPVRLYQLGDDDDLKITTIPNDES